MNPYLFGLMILETCDCGARCRRLFNYDWDDEDEIVTPVALSLCPRRSNNKDGWARIDTVRFYKP